MWFRPFLTVSLISIVKNIWCRLRKWFPVVSITKPISRWFKSDCGEPFLRPKSKTSINYLLLFSFCSGGCTIRKTTKIRFPQSVPLLRCKLSWRQKPLQFEYSIEIEFFTLIWRKDIKQFHWLRLKIANWDQTDCKEWPQSTKVSGMIHATKTQAVQVARWNIISETQISIASE